MKHIKKKIISFMMIMMMTLSQVITYGADTQSASSIWPNPGATKVTKEAQRLPGVATKDEWQITLKVEGKNIELKDTTDVVLVIDRSGSMLEIVEGNTTRAQKTNTAAKGFVQSLLANNADNMKLSIVSFGGYQDNRGNWQIDTTVDAALTNSASMLNGAIDKALKNPKGGTPMKEAINVGGEVLKGGKGKNKIMILLSDGAPTGNSSTVDNAKVNATIAAAATVKNTGVKIYTIGVGTDNMADMTLRAAAQKTLKDCASSTKFYFPVSDTGSALLNIMNAIAREIANGANQVVGLDPMGPNFKLKTNSPDGTAKWKEVSGLSPDVTAVFDFESQNVDMVVSQGKLQYANGTINWDIGNITESAPAVLKYRVKMLDATLGGLHATNGVTTIAYKDAQGRDVLKSSAKTGEDGFKVPMVAVGAGSIRTVGYAVKRVNGKWVPVNRDGVVVERPDLAYELYNELHKHNGYEYLDFATYTIVPKEDIVGYKYVEGEIQTAVTINENLPTKIVFLPFVFMEPTNVKLSISVSGDNYLESTPVVNMKKMPVYGSFWLELYQGNLENMSQNETEKISKATLYENQVPIQVFTTFNTLDDGKIGTTEIRGKDAWGTKVLVKPQTFGTDNEYYFEIETTDLKVGKTETVKVKVPEPTLFGALKGKSNPNAAFKLYNVSSGEEISGKVFEVFDENNELKVKLAKEVSATSVEQIVAVKLQKHSGADKFEIDPSTLKSYLNNSEGKPYVLIAHVNNGSDLDSYFSYDGVTSPILFNVGDKKVVTTEIEGRQVQKLAAKEVKDILGVTTAQVEAHVTYIGMPKTNEQVEKIRVLMATNSGKGVWTNEYYPVVVELKGLSDSFTDMTKVGTTKLRVNQDKMDIYPVNQRIIEPNGKLINENSEAHIFAPGHDGKGGIAGGQVAFKMVKEKDIVAYMKTKYSLEGNAAIAKFDEMLAKGDNGLYDIVANTGNVPFAEGFIIDYIAINHTPEPAKTEAIPPVVIFGAPSKGNVIVPYSVSDLSYSYEISGVIEADDIETSVVSMFNLVSGDLKVKFALDKYMKLSVSTFDGTNYIYNKGLSDKVTLSRALGSGQITLTYPEEMLVAGEYKISLLFSTEVEGIDMDQYKLDYVTALKKCTINVEIKSEVKDDEGAVLASASVASDIELSYNEFISIK